MATLTEMSVITRKSLMWGGIGLVIFLFLRFLFILAIDSYKAAHPPPALPPDVRFDKILPVKFPSDMVSSSGLNFVLQNIEGKPPETTASGRVYFMPKKLSSLLAPQKARDFAAKLNFPGEPQMTSSTLYHFIDSVDPNRTMDLDIVNGNFQIDYNFSKEQNFFTPGNVPPPSDAIGKVKDMISYDNFLSSGPTKTTYLSYNGNDFVPITRSSDAQSIRVDFFRENADSMAFLPPHFINSFNYAILSGNSDIKKQFIKVSYIYWPIDYSNYATYPLKTSDTAWKELVAGSGMIATMGSNSTTDQIVIRKIYLAYYDSGEAENYTQPIFVFEGDNGFAAYVPAVDSAWIQ